MTLYASSDFQAPVISPLDDSLFNLLKKCLVTGFGSFGGLGWMLVHEDASRLVFKSSNGAFLIADATLSDYRFRGAFDLDGVLDFSFPNPHTYKFFPTIYQSSDGFVLSKSSITSDSWQIVGTSRYFYFIHNGFVLFFGSHSKTLSASSVLILSESFGLFQSSSNDHILSNIWTGLMSPSFIGKEEHYLTDTGYQFSNLYLVSSVYGKTLGILPDCFVSKPGVDFEDGVIGTSFGKSMLCKNLNGRYLFFDHNG